MGDDREVAGWGPDGRPMFGEWTEPNAWGERFKVEPPPICGAPLKPGDGWIECCRALGHDSVHVSWEGIQWGPDQEPLSLDEVIDQGRFTGKVDPRYRTAKDPGGYLVYLVAVVKVLERWTSLGIGDRYEGWHELDARGREELALDIIAAIRK